MELSEIEQSTQDLDWFAVDSRGSIAHFASGGKLLPKTVSQSKEDSEKLQLFFRSLSDERTSAETDSQLSEMVELTDDSSRNQYLTDFSSMSQRGLYSYDSPLSGNRSIYFRVASPKTPLTVDDLPDEISALLTRTRYEGEFANTRLIRDDNIN